MPFEHKPGQFSLFQNDRKGNERAPDWKGHGKDMAGNEIEIAIWEKTGSKGTFLSGTIKRKEDRRSERPRSEPNPQSRPQRDPDEIPF